jgi:hypothetical protein
MCSIGRPPPSVGISNMPVRPGDPVEPFVFRGNDVASAVSVWRLPHCQATARGNPRRCAVRPIMALSLSRPWRAAQVSYGTSGVGARSASRTPCRRNQAGLAVHIRRYIVGLLRVGACHPACCDRRRRPVRIRAIRADAVASRPQSGGPSLVRAVASVAFRLAKTRRPSVVSAPAMWWANPCPITLHRIRRDRNAVGDIPGHPGPSGDRAAGRLRSSSR